MTEPTKKTKTFRSPDGYVSVKEVAEKLGLHQATIYQMVAEGRLPESVKFGRLRFWKRSKIDNFVKIDEFEV